MKKKTNSPVDITSRAAPDLPEDLEIIDSPQLIANPNVQLSESLVRGIKLHSPLIKTLRLTSSVLHGVALPNAILESARLTDVRFVDSDLANMQIHAMTAVRVEFAGCRMTGLRLGETEWQSLLLSGGDQRYAQCRFAVFQNSEFDGCDFEDADFYGADLRGCIFRRCNLRNVEMSKAKLSGADLRGSTVDGLRLAAEDIAGAIVDPVQALTFAPLLGIKIM